MKTSKVILLLFLLVQTCLSIGHAQEDDEVLFPTDESSILPPDSTPSSPPVIIDDGDSAGVSDVEDYEG